MVRLTFLFLFLASSAFAQSNFAIVSGTVTDPQHLPVASATVSFCASKTGELRLVTTNEHGLFEVAALLPGDYEVKTEAAGFATAEQTLRLEVGQRLAIEISLQVGAVRQTAEVQGGMEVLRTADASVGEVVEPKSVRELPLNGRMLIDLVLTVPGAHVGFGAQTGQTNPLYWRPGQRSAVVLGGGRSNANFFLLDGATNTDPSTRRT